MMIKGYNVTLKELFTFDINNHKTLVGGVFGIAHGLITAIVCGIGWGISLNHGMWYIMPIFALVIVFYYLYKESKGFTVSPFKKRSSPFVTLDTRADLLVSVIVAIFMLYLRFK